MPWKTVRTKTPCGWEEEEVWVEEEEEPIEVTKEFEKVKEPEDVPA